MIWHSNLIGVAAFVVAVVFVGTSHGEAGGSGRNKTGDVAQAGGTEMTACEHGVPAVVL